MKHYNIGIFAGNRANEYSRQMCHGAENAITEQGHNLVFITEMIPPFSLENVAEHFRFAFEFSARLNLDAYIVPAGSVDAFTANCNQHALYFLKILDPKKTLVIENKIDGYNCFYKDNKPGMHEVITHLIEEHHFERIGMISGPASSYGARERESVFFEEMKLHGLSVPEQRFVRGHFSGECQDVIEKFLDANPDIEAIVCANDQIAITLYDCMKKRGIIPGKDIAVTGFDDISQAALLEPPLTTVRIDAYDMGYTAGQEAIRICQGLPLKHETISSHMIHRNSCGESFNGEQSIYDALLSFETFPAHQVALTILDHTLNIGNETITHAYLDMVEQIVTRGFEIYQSHAFDQPMITAKDINSLLSGDYIDYVSVNGFYITINAYFNAAIERAPVQYKLPLYRELSEFNVLMRRYFTDVNTKQVRSLKRHEYETLQIIRRALKHETYDKEAFYAIIETLKVLNLSVAYIFLFDEPVVYLGTRNFAMPDRLFLKASMDDGHIKVKEDGDAYYDLPSIFDKVNEHRGGGHVYTIAGLFVNNEYSGLFLGETSEADYDEIYYVSIEMGSAIRYLQMIKNENQLLSLLNNNNLILTKQSQIDELSGLLNRRGFMAHLEKLMIAYEEEKAIIFYMDLDDLKHINDTYGHDEGDHALKNISHILRNSFRLTDPVARIGGDEFMAFMIVHDEKAFDEVKQRINQFLDKINKEQNNPYELSISIGHYCFTIHRNMQLEEIIMAADNDLYIHKRKKKEDR